MLIAKFLIALATCSPDRFDANTVNERRIDTGLLAMEVLFGWAALNLAVGGTLYAVDEERGRRRYFHQMNAAWNVVNLGIATAGWVGLRGEQGLELAPAEILTKAVDFEKILLFNAGLDVAYIAAGAFLYERGRRRDSPRLQGYGQSLWLQGGFLFAFDLAVYFATHQHTRTLMDKISVSPFGVTILW